MLGLTRNCFFLCYFRSGQSIFSRPKPIDISTARRAGFMDLEYDSEEEDGELHRPLVRNSVLFEAQEDNNHNNRRPVDGASSNMPKVAQGIRDRDTDDLWAELG